MKKLIISGSAKLYERALYWRGYFEGRGYEVIDWPCPLTDDPDNTPTPGSSRNRFLHRSEPTYADNLTRLFQRFWRNLDQADVFFLMNEDREGIEGYIGSSAIAEITYAVIGNLNRGRKVEIYLLKMPDKSQNCYQEVKFWLDQGWVKIYRHPTGRKALVPIAKTQTAAIVETTDSETSSDVTETEESSEPDQPLNPKDEPNPSTPEPTDDSDEPEESSAEEAVIVESAPAKPQHHLFGHSDERSIDINTCKKKPLRPLTIRQRTYLACLSPDFPAWLLKYIAAPEFQRLKDVSMSSMDYSALYSFNTFLSVFCHSIGVALIVWNFTHDKKQTLAGLFHDIASPAFKHCIDFMNGDAEQQESIEARTGEIIRGSRTIMRQLKKDGILASEVSDYHLYPIADNELPGLAADRLEYTFSNGYFLFDTWNLDDIKRFYSNITVLENESGLDELGFTDKDLAAEFTERNLPLAASYHCDKARASLQFIADIIQSMLVNNYLAEDDLYSMTEREIIDWILSCGDHTLSEAFRNFQRATSVYSGGTNRRNLYTTGVKCKIRHIVPLVKTSHGAKRITSLNRETRAAVEEYLDTKLPKYVGFDFDFKPYSE